MCHSLAAAGNVPQPCSGRHTLLTMDSWLMRSPYFLAQGFGHRDVVTIRPPASAGTTLLPRWFMVNGPTCSFGTTAAAREAATLHDSGHTGKYHAGQDASARPVADRKAQALVLPWYFSCGSSSD